MNDLIFKITQQIFQNSPNLWKISKGIQNSKKQEPTFFDTLVILRYTLYIECVLQVSPRPVRGRLGGSSSCQQPRVPPQLRHPGAVQQLQQGGTVLYCTVLYCSRADIAGVIARFYMDFRICGYEDSLREMQMLLTGNDQ